MDGLMDGWMDLCMASWTVPFRGWVKLHRNDLQSVPSGHAGTVEETLPTYHGSLAEAQQQQEGAGGRGQHGATWTEGEMDDDRGEGLTKIYRQKNPSPAIQGCSCSIFALCVVTYNPDPSYLVHEKRRKDVARQHGQTAQEADHVDDNVVFLLEVQMAAFLGVEEGGVFHPTVFELFLPEV